MAGRGRQLLALFLAAAAAAALAACGGGDSTSPGETAGGPQASKQAPPAASGEKENEGRTGPRDGGSPTGEKKQEDRTREAAKGSGGNAAGGSGGSGSGEASDEFRTPGGDNSVQEYGSEAGDAEREAVSKVVEGYMAGRAAGDWAKVCSLAAADVVASLEKIVEPGGGCVGTFEAIAKRVPPSALANTMVGPVASLRVEGGKGFALFHGKGGKDYLIQVTQEAGAWKVAGLEPTEIP